MILTLISILLMTLDHRSRYTDTIRSAISVIVYPIQAAVNLPTATGHWLSENFTTRNTLLRDNAILREKQIQLEARLMKFEAMEVENRRLRALLGSSFRLGEKTLVSELLAIDMEPFSQKVVLNKGTRDKVYVGQPVLDAKGIFGQVIRTYPLTSTVMLLTDPAHGIPVEVNRNGLRSVANGTGQADRLELLHIPNNADIESGDLLVTSGLGGRFPPGYPVASVTEVTSTPGQPFAEVFAEPAGKLDRSREVLLVWTEDLFRDPANSPEAEDNDAQEGDKP